jgi:hypothetical protein
MYGVCNVFIGYNDTAQNFSDYEVALGDLKRRLLKEHHLSMIR